MRTSLMMLVLILGAAVTGGCSSHSSPAWMSLNPTKWSDRSDADDPVMLEVSGPLAIDVESFNGDVTIIGNEKARTATIRVVRTGLHGNGRSKEAKTSLADISATAEIVAGELGQVLQVRTSTSNGEPHFQRAHVEIEAPLIDGVSVHTHNGKVWVRNVAGAVDISTDEGSVRVMSNQPMLRPVTIVNRNGDIDYRVRGESTGQLDCETVDGEVHYRVRYGKVRIMSPTDNDTLNATLNDGTNPVRLRTVNGDIRVAVIHNPEEVGEHIMTGL